MFSTRSLATASPIMAGAIAFIEVDALPVLTAASLTAVTAVAASASSSAVIVLAYIGVVVWLAALIILIGTDINKTAHSARRHRHRPGHGRRRSSGLKSQGHQR